jgi:hypothetical protein
MGKIAFMGEGQGEDIPSAIYLMEPEPPYNTTGKLVTVTESLESSADVSDPQQLLWTTIQFA